MTREEILEELVEAGELYLNLEEYIRISKIENFPSGKNRENVSPGLDILILRSDIWRHIKDLAQKLPSL